ncbi:MAG TPA: hypothetical protein VIL68_05925 [Propionibacteriaceae bacterium]|jgi:DnaJ-class molecular chaperone
MSPVAWMEHLTPGNCVLCNEPRLTHDDAACARFTTDDELCDVCEGSGILGNVRRSDFDGRKCSACAGAGYVESSSQAGEPA